MPGNEGGDRVHNFFSQENFSQGLQHSHGNWHSDNNLWNNSQKQTAPLSFDTKSYDAGQSEIESRHNNLLVNVQNGLNYMQTTSRPEFTKNPSQIQHQNLNEFMDGRHILQPRLDEANFLGLDTTSAQDNVNQMDFFAHGSHQGGVSEQVSNGSLNRFGGQQHQMNSQHSNLMQQVQHQQQQIGFSDSRHFQQQFMLRKMQEIQREKDIQQLNTQKHISVNQGSLFARPPPGSSSNGLINGFSSSEPLWSEPSISNTNTNWLQQSDQSLYGVPVSNSWAPQNSYPYGVADKPLSQQSPTIYGNSFHGNQYGQNSNNWINMDQIQHMKPAHQTGSDQVFRGPQDLIGPSEMALNEPAVEASDGAASLDPEEEKFLFGSDVNIWDAFGSDINMDDDNNEFASGNGNHSIQSGSWSALMQSAVAETSRSDLDFHNLEHSSRSGLSFGVDGSKTKDKQSPYENDVKPQNNSSGQVNRYSSGGNNWSNDWIPVDKANNTSNNHYSMQESLNSNHTRVMHKEIGQKVNSGFASSIVDPGPTNASVGSPQMSGEGFTMNSAVAKPNFGINSHQLNSWKNVESSVRIKGSRNLRKPQSNNNNMNMNSQVSESSFNSSDKEDLKMHEIESRSRSRSRRENSNDSYQSSSSCHVSSASLREISTSDAGDLRALQQFKRLRGQDQGYFGHTTISGQGSVPDAKVSNDIRSKGDIGFSTPDKGSQPRQNMLELIQKLDQSRNRGLASHFSSIKHNLSTEKIHEPDCSDGSSGRIQPSNSQGFDLHLGHSSLRLPLPDKSQPLLTSLPTFYESSKQQDFTNQTRGVQLNTVGSTSSSFQNVEDQEAEKRRNPFPNFGTSSLNSQGLASALERGPEKVLCGKVDRSQTKSDNLDQDSSLMNQMRALKNVNNDSRNRATKRLKGSYNLLNSSQQNEQPFSGETISNNSNGKESSVGGESQHLGTLTPKKQRLTTAGIHPWLLEVSGSFKNLQGICTGAMEWSITMNQLMEKVDDDGHLTEDALTIPKSKKRLILTSLFIQQLFRPPPSEILLEDASSKSNNESLVYHVARLALGDACNLASFASNNSNKSLSDKSQKSGKLYDDGRLLEAIEDFTSKTEKLEDDFLRFEKMTSFLDMKVEFQDLERFCLVNHFARFHGGGRLRRYCKAVAMPVNLPDAVQCLSL